MKFRLLLLLLGALCAGIASAPLKVRIGVALVLGIWFGVDLLLEELRQRRARRRSKLDFTCEVQPWVDCDAFYFAPFGADPMRGGLRGQCHARKGHDETHEACVYVEWAD